MSGDEQLLQLFSIGLIAVLGLAIVVPYLARRADLLTARNVFLTGGIIFLGLSGIDCSLADRHHQDYSTNTYLLYMAGIAVFFPTLLITYHFWKLPRKIGAHALRGWPELRWHVVFTAIAIAIGLNLFPRVVSVPGLTQIVFQLGEKAIAAAVGIAFFGWYRNRVNPVMAALLIGVLGWALLMAVLLGGSRRTFLAVIIVMPIILYWVKLRYRSPLSNLTVAFACGIPLIALMGSFAEGRWFDLGREGIERNVENSVNFLSDTIENVFSTDLLHTVAKAGQNATEISLLCIHRTSETGFSPFESVILVAVNPVPRFFWPSKPKTLGLRVVEDTLGIDTLNWGPSIIGHSFYEGGETLGLLMILIYGVLYGGFLRIIDQCLYSQSNNPYILAAFGAMSAHLMALPRGDISVIGVQLAGSILLAFFLKFVLGAMFGKQDQAPAIG